jgi:hypothetical protein
MMLIYCMCYMCACVQASCGDATGEFPLSSAQPGSAAAARMPVLPRVKLNPIELRLADLLL